MPVMYLRTDAGMTSLRGVTLTRDQSQSCRQRFLKLRAKQNEKYSALAEDFNEKQAADNQLQ